MIVYLTAIKNMVFSDGEITDHAKLTEFCNSEQKQFILGIYGWKMSQKI